MEHANRGKIKSQNLYIFEDYSEDEDGRPSKTLASEEKSKYENGKNLYYTIFYFKQ